MPSEILNSRDSVLRRLAEGPLTQAEITTGYTNRILVRLQRQGLVENLFRVRGAKCEMIFRFKNKGETK